MKVYMQFITALWTPPPPPRKENHLSCNDDDDNDGDVWVEDNCLLYKMVAKKINA